MIRLKAPTSHDYKNDIIFLAAPLFNDSLFFTAEFIKLHPRFFNLAIYAPHIALIYSTFRNALLDLRKKMASPP